ncbi:MAG: Asp-tRNA(Asn)/Glu-tRNA(Gln) amidotransferase subunit GatA, partial [Bacteroidales bacterium]|nr:Asp-tRNA(Asn)/Glu-tRNA(Gln) amidotransferase subunit GatA [Bacteroidales bacterium]
MESEILKTHKELLDGKFTCTGLLSRKISELEGSPNNTANYLLTDTALERASKVDEKLKAGNDIGLLEGIPFGIKDVFLLQGRNASASSDFLKNYIAPYTATAIQKLCDAGAIPIVKENCDCFGHGSSNENTVFGAVRNAINEELVPGGSSGGSAVNVAKGHTVFSIGGDTGGSIRQPAGYNKVYGLKPTYGRVSRYGLMAYASSTDCVGPISRSLEDIRILLNTMSGRDRHDQTTIESSPVSEDIFREEFRKDSLKIGYYKSFIENNDLDPEIKKDFLDLINRLKQHNIEVRMLDFFDTDILVSTYYVLAMAETASNLARLDGMSYGKRISAETLKEGYALTRSENFTEETKRRIIAGNQILSQGHAEEIYLKARTLRNQIISSFNREFRELDIIISPVSPGPPPKIGSSLDNPLGMYLSDAYTVGFSLGGLP